MKVFLTGGSGFLGAHVLKKLKENNIETVALMRDLDGSLDFGNGLLKICQGDITNIATYEEYVKDCDVVIHTAAIASFNVKNSDDYYKVNYIATKNLFDIAKNSGVKRFIYISSRGTIGVENDSKASNELTARPETEQLDDYMKSKLLSEEYILNEQSSSSLDVLILSPTALLGSYDIKPTPIGKIIKNLLDNNVKTYLHGGINIIDVDDASIAVVNAIDEKVQRGVYILGGHNISLYELFRQVCDFAGTTCPRIKIPYAIAYAGAWVLSAMTKFTSKPAFATPRKVYTLHHSSSYCCSDKAIQHLNLPVTPLSGTIQKTVKWFKDN